MITSLPNLDRRIGFRAVIAACSMLFMLAAGGSVRACGQQTNCDVGDRYYRVALPATIDPQRPLGALVFAHGYRGSAEGVIRHDGLRELADELDLALIALQSAGDDWSIPGAPGDSVIEGVDEMAYVDAVLADASERFGIDPTRRVASGFSAGGMMVWNIACYRSRSFAGFVPIAGTFWQPTPASCPSPPASIVHIHGETDQIVPLAGRPIQDTRQGDIAEVTAMYARTGGFGEASPMTLDDLRCERRDRPDGHLLALCLHPEGHSLRVNDLRQAWAMLAEAHGF